MRTKAEDKTLATALEIARMKRTLKRLPRISKRGNVSLLDLFPHLDVGEILVERQEKNSAGN